MKARRYDADDHAGCVVKADGLAHDARFGAELRLPQAVAQHDRSFIPITG